MAIPQYINTIGFAQLTAMTTAVGLANGYDTVSTVAVVGTSSGTGYHRGDVVQLSGGTGSPCILYITNHNTTGNVLGVDFTYGGAGIQSGFWPAASTPGTSNVTVSNIQVQNAAATGLALTVTYSTNSPPQQTQFVSFQAVNQNVMWRDDGVVPTTGTTGVGEQVVTGQNPWPYNGNPANVSVIQVTTGAILNVRFSAAPGNFAQGR